MISLRRFCHSVQRLLVAALFGSTAATAVWSAEPAWPNRPVKLIVPLAPGGTADATARILAEQLTRRWGQPVIVDNRAGAGGVIAMDALSHAAPDGYTLGIGNLNTMVTNPHVLRKLPYDPGSLTSITWLTTSPLFLIVNPQLPVKTLNEFIAYVKTHPDELSFASIGNGSTMHLATVQLMQRAGLRMVHVPYKGMGTALQDLVAGHVNVALDISAMSMVRSGKLRAIAVAADERYPGAPEIPAFGEVGIKGLQLVTFLSLHGPQGMKPELAKRISSEVSQILSTPEVMQRIKAMNLDPQGGSPERLDAFLAGERRRYAEVIQRAGLQPE